MRVITYFSIAVLFMLAGCDPNRVYEENRDIGNEMWDVKERAAFDFDIPDTTTAYNLYFNVRNTDDFPYRNLFVFSHISFPNGKQGIDTVELPLTNPDGSWVGSGQGDLHDCRLIFRRNVRFPVAGRYHLEVEQAMRMQLLPGIRNIGIRIEKAE